jgi:N-acetylmuramoyl-L-alanine amidase
MNYRHKSPFKNFHKKCLGVFYDYRNIAIIFCCYSLIGTGLVLGASSLFGEDAVLYRLSGQMEPEGSSEVLIAEAAAFQEQNIDAILEKFQSNKVSYSLTDDDSSESRQETSAESTEKSSKKLSSKSSAKASTSADETDTAADTSQQEALSSAAKNAESELAASEKKKEKTAKKSASAGLPYDISDYSDKEIRILEKIVEAEAGDQSVKGRMMVADVVLNRVSSEEFPDTIKEVVFQKTDSIYQFSPIKDGRYFDVTVSAKTKKAVAKAFQSEDMTDGALYFMSRSGSSEKNVAWFDSSLTRITAYGCHEFFK